MRIRLSALVLSLLLFSDIGVAQNKMDWDSSYKLQLSDFQSRTTQIGDVKTLMINSGVQFDFQFS